MFFRAENGTRRLPDEPPIPFISQWNLEQTFEAHGLRLFGIVRLLSIVVEESKNSSPKSIVL